MGRARQLERRIRRALERGDAEEAEALIFRAGLLKDAEDIDLAELKAELAHCLAKAKRYDDAIVAMEWAIGSGWQAIPYPRCDIAEFHLLAGRREEAAGMWERLREETPGDVWLHNHAGMAYQAVDEHEEALRWLGDGLELALGEDHPEELVGQLLELRARSLDALGCPPEPLDEEAERYLEEWIAAEDARLAAARRAARAEL